MLFPSGQSARVSTSAKRSTLWWRLPFFVHHFLHQNCKRNSRFPPSLTPPITLGQKRPRKSRNLREAPNLAPWPWNYTFGNCSIQKPFRNIIQRFKTPRKPQPARRKSKLDNLRSQPAGFLIQTWVENWVERKLDALGSHIMIDPYPNGFREEPDGKNSSYSVRKQNYFFPLTFEISIVYIMYEFTLN